MCAFLQVVLRAATQRRLIQAQHAPTHGVAIAAMARRAVVALQGVGAHQIEKCVGILFESSHYLKLLLRSERGQLAAEAFTADRISLLQAVAIGILVTPEVTDQLLIDISE